MRYVVSAMLAVVAVIHLLPLSGVLGADRLSTLYGVTLTEPNVIILMRHRAVLFGLLGVVLGVSAFVPALQPWTLMAGTVSVGSFLLLAWGGGYNASVGRVVAVDVLAAVCLVIGGIAHLMVRRAA